MNKDEWFYEKRIPMVKFELPSGIFYLARHSYMLTSYEPTRKYWLDRSGIDGEDREVLEEQIVKFCEKISLRLEYDCNLIGKKWWWLEMAGNARKRRDLDRWRFYMKLVRGG